MNRILKSTTLCFAAIEPGVIYQQMYDEPRARGHTLMMDTRPARRRYCGTLDKGAGYTPYFDHFGRVAEMEVVRATAHLAHR
jgi:4-cresol dehydrogenase (hydroxylating)